MATLEERLTLLMQAGYCPYLLCDDEGHWAVTLTSMDTTDGIYIPVRGDTAPRWFDSIEEAVSAAERQARVLDIPSADPS
jgi:hypothetical protein